MIEELQQIQLECERLYMRAEAKPSIEITGKEQESPAGGGGDEELRPQKACGDTGK